MHLSVKTSILVFGNPEEIVNELKHIEQTGHSLTYVGQPLPKDREELINRFKELTEEISFDAVLLIAGHGYGKLDEEIWKPFLPSLKCVCGTGAGFDHIDAEWLAKSGVWYANTPTAVAEPTATTSVTLILQTVRATSEAEHNLREGRFRDGLTWTPDVRGLVVGIFGMGTIGQLVNQKLQALGFKVIYHNRNRLPREKEGNAEYVTFDELLSKSRLITLHCPLTPETHHLLNDRTFSKMQDGVFIVNTSRGPVIDEEALVRAMQSGKVLRVGLDVFEREPEVHPWLMQSYRASLLPHFAAGTDRIMYDIQHEALANLTHWMEEGIPNTPANDPSKY